MLVNNTLEENSFCYIPSRKNMGQRSEELGDLASVAAYCERIKEKIKYDEWKLYDMEVQEGILLSAWLFENQGEGREEDRRLLLELLTKDFVTLREEEEGAEIRISLGPCKNSVSNEREYRDCRRELLAGIDNPEEYADFMGSCFQNSVFSDDIAQEMKYIEDFSTHTREITESLSVLNDEAVTLYETYHDNLKAAIDILSAKLRECSLDPSHRKYLSFRFTYEEVLNGENCVNIKQKDITCEPHLKLVRKDSNLRIYFWWCDMEIGQGEKVLVGRIGRHPYKK